MEFLPRELIEIGTAGILLALFLGTFVSEDLACITAGSLIAAGRIDGSLAVMTCFAGIVAGDLLLFGAGRLFGERVLASPFASRLVSPRTVDRASRRLSARGISAVFVCRFVSGARLPVYLLSGILRLDGGRFTLAVAVGAAIWVPAIVLTAAFWNMAVPLGAAVALIAFFVLFRSAFRLTDRRSRRLLAGKIRRIWNWEFWPLWLFYVPVFIYVVYLAARFRGMHFTAANPGIPSGGFVGESKDEIYKLIARSAGSSGYLLRHILLPKTECPGERYRRATAFIEVNKLSYPVVVKPDAGERGNGVRIIHNDRELEVALSEMKLDVLLQEYAGGVEASVFYYRFPSASRGKIFSITEKIFPSVAGDGISDVEDLILADPRAHIIAESYFKRLGAQLRYVPEQGEVFELVDIGTHSKGAIFRDGGWLNTEQLETAIDELARDIPGFYFGRFDLRAESLAGLRAGKFRIIELNGVTSESTNIYDPKFSLFDAYLILFKQWRIAFEIGAENASMGSRRSTVLDLISLYLKSRRLA